jgi:hypothetical protein
MTAIGAHVMYTYGDRDMSGEIIWRNGYVSFSQWEDDAEVDAFGVDDNTIVYYFPEGEEELKTYLEKQWDDEDGHALNDIMFDDDYEVVTQ